MCVKLRVNWESAVKVSVAQSCLTFCDPVDYSPSGSSVHGILQARILEWLAIDRPNPGIKPGSPALQADSLPSEPPGKPKQPPKVSCSLKTSF